MVGIEAYLSIRRHNSNFGLSPFEDDESGKGPSEKVSYAVSVNCCKGQLLTRLHIANLVL